MKLLVTGGAGYIGSVATAQLLEAGHEAVVFYNLSSGSESVVPEGARLVQGDLLDVNGLRSVLAEGFDGAIHLAARSVVGESVERQELYYRTNVCGTLNLLDAIRDYIHVEDLGRAHLLALEAAEDGEHSIYNLGNGEGFSVLEVVETARRVTGLPIEAVESPRRAGDPAVVVASSERIRSELGWEPEKSDLETMIFDALNWLQTYSPER